MADFVNSNVTQRAYGPAHILSLENASLIKRGIYPKVFKQFGKQYGIHDMLMAANMEVSVPSQNQTVVEKYAPYWPIKIDQAISTGAAGANISIVVSSDSLVSNKHLARVGFVVRIPRKYQQTGVTTDRDYVITALGDTNVTNDTLTCAPLTKAGTNVTASRITTEVPAGTYLTLGYSTWARGGTQPASTTDFPVTRSYTSQIIAETKGFDGAALAHEGEIAEYDGVRYMINEAVMEAEFSLKDQKEDAVVYGELNDNTTLTETATVSGEDAARRTTKGLVRWLDEAGQKIWLTSAFAIADLKKVIKALQSQGVYTGFATIFCSPAFAQDIYDNLNNYIKEYSGGADYLDSSKTALGIIPQVIKYGGMTFYIHPVASLGKPGSYGLNVSDVYQLDTGKMAIVVPDARATVNQWGMEANVTIPNLWMGYVNHNGENRKHMLKRQLGVNGVFDTIDVSGAFDGYKLYWKSEFMLGGAEWNKMVIIRQSTL